jgi:hypothetical protein
MIECAMQQLPNIVVERSHGEGTLAWRGNGKR